MKNKIYIICQTASRNVIIYNIMKMKKIKEIKSVSLDRLIELLAPHDSINLKSWFQIDIKLGVISIIFNKDSFNNPLNFDFNYLDNILDRYVNDNDIEGLKNAHPAKILDNHNISKVVEKNSSCAMHLIQSMFNNMVSTSLTSYNEFFENNFYDTNGYIKKKFLSNTTVETGTSQIYSNFELFSTIDSYISLSGYMGDNIKSNFQVPYFLKDIVKIVTNYNIANRYKCYLF
jgi:hypothetical protein